MHSHTTQTFKGFFKSLMTLNLKSILQVLISLIIGFVISNLKLDYLEYYFFDVRQRIAPESPISNNIQLIFNDAQTISDLLGEPEFKHYADLVDKLESSKPRFIIFNIDPTTLSGAKKDKDFFISEINKYKNIYFTTEDLELKGETNRLKYETPFQDFKLGSAPKTADTKLFAKDNVTRRMLISYQDKKMLHYQIAESYNNQIESLENVHGLFELLESYQVYIRFHPTGSFPRKSIAEFLKSPTDVTDKIVVIGADNNKTFRDYIATPFSRDSVAMTTTEMHANMIETLIQNNAPKNIHPWVQYLITILISVLTLHIVLTLRPAHGLIILSGAFTAVILFSFILYWLFGLLFQMANPLLAIFLCYYFFIPYRLIIENRRSWEYYQKHQILQQVEELKTNFISMMSHDLKTPIARILGMTDLILKDETSLSSNQREALDTIKQSSDDLLKFINAILQYGRIESANVQLNLQNKDINSLIKEVTKKHEFLAKIKKIQVLQELEPLFPIEVDPELIKQVFSNLLENAIKYSPEETKILITSEEKNNKVIIQFSDQGPGIPSDELSNIFMKFFRSKEAKTSTIKGSGLGLYLAKYFTEIHQGSIFVESSLGKGSTFIVELPLEQRRNHAKNSRG